MTSYVYDYPSGGAARFYIDGEYVFPLSGTQPAFLDQWGILVSQPSYWHSSISGKRQIRLCAAGLQHAEVLFKLTTRGHCFCHSSSSPGSFSRHA